MIIIHVHPILSDYCTYSHIVLEKSSGPLTQILVSSDGWGRCVASSERDIFPVTPFQLEDGDDKMCTTPNLQQ